MGLVVEDEVHIRRAVAEYLRISGNSVVEAANAAEAIAVFAAGVPIDVVFSDIHMPGPMDGLGLALWTITITLVSAWCSLPGMPTPPVPLR